MKLLSLGSSNAKLSKSDAISDEYKSAILYLAPHKQAGIGNLCPAASPGCAAACLHTAGYGVYDNVQQARIKKARLYQENREQFLFDLRNDIRSFIGHCERRGLKPAIRLNGTSDIAWERHGLMEWFPIVQFYDYTKRLPRMLAYCRGHMPKNYHLTFSRSENNHLDCLRVLRAGGNVAAVFKHIPVRFARFRVIDGDTHDLRFIDERTRWVGLTPKGRARKDKSGFVIDPDEKIFN